MYNTLIDHDDIVGRLNRGQTTGPAQANRDDLARLFELDEVLVMGGVHNTAKQGASASMKFIAGKNALLAYRAPNPGLWIPSAGYTFDWTGYAGNIQDGIEISRFWMQPRKATRVEGEMAWDQKLVSADLGAFLNGIVS